MNFSFVIVNYNTAQLIKNCLESIFSNCQTNNFEIIVIDNASSDNSVKILEKEFTTRIKLIKNQVNLGFARANNRGAEKAIGRYLFFLNSDTLIKEDILSPLENILNENPLVGIVAPQLINLDGSPQFGAYGSFPKIKTLIQKRFQQQLINNTGDIISPDWVSGAALIIKSDLFQELGGWDEKFFMYLEDVDLCYRAQKINRTVAVLKTASVIHLLGKSLNNNRLRKKHYFHSQAYFFSKHYGWFNTLLLRIIRWPYKTWKLLTA